MRGNRKEISEDLRREVIQRDGLYCRSCGFGPMPISWRYDPKRRVRITVGTIDLDLSTQLQLDHVVPVNAGGKTVADNLVVYCAGCNMAKGHKVDADPDLVDPAPMSLIPDPPTHLIEDWHR